MSNPTAERVAEVLIRQSDPANWSDEMWAAHEEDMNELREVVKREQEKHFKERDGRHQGSRNL